MTYDPPSYLKQAFAIDSATGAVLLEVRSRGYESLFNSVNLAPLRRRDISGDLKQFLVECSAGIPLTVPVVLVIALEGQAADATLESEVKAGLRTYFSYMASVIDNDLRAERTKLVKFVLLSVAIMSAAVLLGNSSLSKTGLVYTLLSNGLTVGGWVFLWEALYSKFIRRIDAKSTQRRYERLRDATVQFVYDARG